MAERVQAYDADGNLGTVDAKDTDALVRSGGHVATAEEKARLKADADYAKQSTAMKVATAATMLGPVGWAGHLALRAAGGTLAPEVEAYKEGVSDTFTGGLASVGMKEAVEAVGGKAAAHAYGQNAQATAKAYSGMHSAGMAAGLVGGAVATPGAGSAAAKFVPGMAAETGAKAVLGRVLGAKAATVGGRALTTAVGMGVRGGVEGALLAGANEFSEESLGDHELAGQKIMIAAGTGFLYGGAGGAVMGGAGSLAASGARGATRAIGSGLGRLSKRIGSTAERAASGAADDAKVLAAGAQDVAEGEARAAAVPGAKASLFTPEGATARVNSMGNQAAVDSLGARQSKLAKLMPSKKGGIDSAKMDDVGDWLVRKVIRPGADDTSLVGTALRGRADDLAPLVAQQKTEAFAAIGKELEPHGKHMMEASGLIDGYRAVHDSMLGDARRVGAKGFANHMDEMFESLAHSKRLQNVVRDESGRIVGGDIATADAYFARSEFEKSLHNLKGGNPIGHKEAKGFMREMDRAVLEHAGKIAEEAGDPAWQTRMRGLKKEAHLAAIAEELAEDGAKRVNGNKTFGLKAAIMGGGGATAGAVAGGMVAGPVGAVVGAKVGSAAYGIGSKVATERGDAMLAYALTRAAQGGHVARMVAKVDASIGKAARGMVEPPPVTPRIGGYRANASKGGQNIRVAAGKAAERARSVAANPDAAVERVAAATASMAEVAPNVTGSYVAASVRAAAFLESKIPHNEDPDPLDPHPRPRMTDAQAASFLETAAYVENPQKFFDDAAKGRITPEGVEVARELMPGAFAELQERTIAAIADYHASNRIIPYQRRERLGLLLDIPLVPSQRPGHRAFLQGNVAPQQQSAPAPSRKPMKVNTPQSALDRLEGGNGKSH